MSSPREAKPLRLSVGASAYAEALSLSQRRVRVTAEMSEHELPIDGLASSRDNLESQWHRLKTEFERTRPGRKVIYIIHDAPDFITAGTTFMPILTPEQATDIVSQIMLTRNHTPIEVILHTFGGSAAATEVVAEALLARGNATAYIPFYAMSAGTMIALATRKIVMGKHASLGPTDLQISGFPARDYEELIRQKGITEVDDATALTALVARKVAKSDVRKVCKLINSAHKRWIDRLRGKCVLAEQLTLGEMEHGHRINFKECKKLGMNVRRGRISNVSALVNARREQLRQLRRLEAA